MASELVVMVTDSVAVVTVVVSGVVVAVIYVKHITNIKSSKLC